MIIVGVDPGKKGAMCVMNIFKPLESITLAFEKNTVDDMVYFLSGLRGGDPDRNVRAQHTKRKGLKKIENPLQRGPIKDNSVEIWLEEPAQIIPYHSNKDPGKAIMQGAVASRKLARSVGFWEGIAAALAIPVVCVPPKKWMGALYCKTKGNKTITTKLAKKLFPHLTAPKNGRTMDSITGDVADSILIATYGYMNYVEPVRYMTRLKDHLRESKITKPPTPTRIRK